MTAAKSKRTALNSTRRATTQATADTTVDITRLLDLVAAFPRQTIGVVGDFVLDEFVSGEISRVSREAPVLILRHRRSESYPGGAANAVNNLADLGARVLPVGIVGNDEGGRKLFDHFRRKRINVSGILRAPDWSTTTKTRYLAGWTHTTEQQVLRVDREPQASLSSHVEKAIAHKAHQVAGRADAVLISDYGLGAASPALAKSLKAKRITLDSRYRLLEYRAAGITAATPNEPEVEAAYQSRVGTNTAKLDELGQRAVRDLGLEALLVTRGKDGMAVFERSRQPRHIPIYGSDAPVDVTGAGDTVIAVFTLALAAGASYLEAAHLANYAGGIVVMKRHTATVTRVELEAALRQDATAQR
ncbi:MAG TPA: PfkB family carbohydrate kinase [Candidatus Acidoferrales bacterium]|nr:PfkB family carbohydrate kinase [Candidatus Acidoferrales bacterium]